MHVLVFKDMLEPQGIIGNNNLIILPNLQVPLFRLDLLTEKLLLGGGKVPQGAYMKNQWSVSVPLGPEADSICP